MAGIDGHRLIAPDLPGHGQSEGEARSSVADYSDFVFDFMEVLGLSRIVIGGHSLGGAIALDFTLTRPHKRSGAGYPHHVMPLLKRKARNAVRARPDLVEGLILVGSGGRLRVKPETLEILAKGEHSVRNVEHSYALNVSTEVLDRAASEMADVSTSVYLADFRACDSFDVLDRLGDIRVPTLVICGKDDRMTPVKFSEYLSGRIPNAKLSLVTEAGHMVMIEQPGVVNNIIMAFLNAHA